MGVMDPEWRWPRGLTNDFDELDDESLRGKLYTERALRYREWEHDRQNVHYYTLANIGFGICLQHWLHIFEWNHAWDGLVYPGFVLSILIGPIRSIVRSIDAFDPKRRAVILADAEEDGEDR